MKFKKGDAIFANCTNPATGHIKRLAKDNSWADVEWIGGLNHHYVKRTPTSRIILLMPILNEFVNNLTTNEKVED